MIGPPPRQGSWDSSIHDGSRFWRLWREYLDAKKAFDDAEEALYSFYRETELEISDSSTGPGNTERGHDAHT